MNFILGQWMQNISGQFHSSKTLLYCVFNIYCWLILRYFLKKHSINFLLCCWGCCLLIILFTDFFFRSFVSLKLWFSEHLFSLCLISLDHIESVTWFSLLVCENVILSIHFNKCITCFSKLLKKLTSFLGSPHHFKS